MTYESLILWNALNSDPFIFLGTHTEDEILFYKSDKSGRWWIEIPYPNSDRSKFQRHLLVPCTYQVYEQALQNEMPSLWWKTYQKLI